MASVINTNVASLNAQRNLTSSQGALNTSLQRLSSGLRINSAKDDAAGLAIAEGMTSQIRGLNQAARNANDGISLAQTAEGSLAEVTNNLQRIRELSIQSANGTLSASDRSALDTEVTALSDEITRVIQDSDFNGVTLLSGGGVSASIQVGSSNGDTVSIAIGDLSGVATTIAAGSISGAAGASAMIDLVDTALTSVNNERASLGAVQNRFESIVRSVQTASENLSAARSRIQDTDFAMETANLTRAQILQQAGTAMLSQANSAPQNVLALLQ